MLLMGAKPWQTLIWSLRAACLLLFAALVFLLRFQESGSLAHLRLSGTMQDFAQLALLAGVLVPVCLEDLLPPGPGSGQSRPFR
jgi:hypothetical protein